MSTENTCGAQIVVKELKNRYIYFNVQCGECHRTFPTKGSWAVPISAGVAYLQESGAHDFVGSIGNPHELITRDCSDPLICIPSLKPETACPGECILPTTIFQDGLPVANPEILKDVPQSQG